MKIIRPGKIDFFPSIFLAGPCYRQNKPSDQLWRTEALRILEFEKFDGEVYLPEPYYGSYEEQIAWEEYHLNKATCILFWIPRDLEELPGFTTNIEFGDWMRSRKIVAGWPKNTPKMKYFSSKAERYNIPIAVTLFGTIELALDLIAKERSHYG